MKYDKFMKEFNKRMDDLYQLLEASGAPERAWIDAFDIYRDSVPDDIGEYLED